MRIIFWGTSGFAIPCLDEIAKSGHKVISVITQKDSRKGRHLRLVSPPVKVRAIELGFDVLQPEDIGHSDFIGHLKSLNPDLFVVVSYGSILDKEILDIPRLYCVNLHASLLPRYRGGSPINRAIENGEKETGVSIIKMNEEMDAGEILGQANLTIADDDTAVSLEEKLSRLGADLMANSLGLIEKNKINSLPQDETLVSFAPCLKKEDGRIIWTRKALDLHNQVRAMQPWPATYCFYKEALVKIWKTRYDQVDIGETPGKITEIAKDAIAAGTGKGILMIEELQVSSGRRMHVREFLLGHRISKGDSFQ